MSFATLERLLKPSRAFHWATHPELPDDDEATPSAIHRRGIRNLIFTGSRLEAIFSDSGSKWAELEKEASLLARNHDTALIDPVLNQEWGKFLEKSRALIAPRAAA